MFVSILSPCMIFQSTPSARRATCFCFHSTQSTVISIHALREEGDQSDELRAVRAKNFNPRPPRGGRLSLTS